MRLVFLFVLVLTQGVYVAGVQSEIDFLENYNLHIDPMHRLDTIKLLTLIMKLEITYTMNSQTRDLNNLRFCSFSFDGTRKCTDLFDGSAVDLGIIPIPSGYFENKIKYQLNFIKNKEGETNKYLTVNDSITTIEKTLHSGAKNIYTFETETKNLLQIETISAKDGTSFSYSKITSYQKIDEILVPQTMTYTTAFCTGLIEYQSIEFK